ncbi:MAG: metal ABC transporter permease [Chloroflexaceae bacterium]|nr:metal ABC transporter permease [Chloroflexaceae bacterium]NJO07436.1 metal ABC transporter permease [Chloroflexaceae bacterium]
MELLNSLMEPLQFPFIVRGLIAAMLVGVVCSVVGTFVVLRGMSFLGFALSHAILPGVAIGFLQSDGDSDVIFWWGLGAAILTSLGIGMVSRRTNLSEDTAIGIVFAGMFALGIAIISTIRTFASDLVHVLFGNVLGVSNGDLWRIALFGVLVLLIVFALYKELVVLAFDEVHATTLRLPVTFLSYLLLVLVAVVIMVAMQTVGVALMLAMLTTPPATALLLTRRLPVVMALAAGIGAFSGFAGLYLSYYISVASGAAIVLMCTALFGLTFLIAPRRGWLWQFWTRSDAARLAVQNQGAAKEGK